MVQSKSLYTLPMRQKDFFRIQFRKSPAHRGKLKHAVDFMCSEGKHVYAAAPGKVVWIKQNSRNGGISRKYWYDGNRVVLQHGSGEYSAYEHLQYHGIKVKVGQQIRKGQLLGTTGATGFLGRLGPHLHFEVFIQPIQNLSEGETVQVRFHH